MTDADPLADITFIPADRLRCVVTGVLRRGTPEENVRQRVARSLIDDYGYRTDDLAIEFPIYVASRRKRVDVAVFLEEAEHIQQNIRIIVECKQERVKPSDEDNGIGQLESYVAACLNCQFGMWVGSEMQVWEKVQTEGGLYDFAQVVSIPRFGADAPQPPRFADLVPFGPEMQSSFRRCHNYIHGNQGLQKEAAFHELLKLIFCKVQDESDIANPLRFFIGNQESLSMLGRQKLRQAMDGLFADVKARYSYIFGAGDTIDLHDRVLAYVVGELQRYSLIQTKADVKGVAYEQLVGANLRGDRGEFFTPRSVCHMASEMVLATFPQDRWLTLNVLDPAAGTGGFLVTLMDVLQEHVRGLAQERWGEDDQKVGVETKEQLRSIASSHLYGVDFNPILVKAAQMNLVMHGDGSTNVFHADSLLPPGEWPDEEPNNVARNIRFGYFDAILTNPPFGSKIPIDDPHVLAQFEIAGKPVAPARRRAVPPDQLFIERCLQLLRPGGRLAIVLPDSILTNPGLAWLRRWMLAKARVVASIDLPKEAFQPHTGTQTSVLLLQKKTQSEMEAELAYEDHIEYEVFMAMPRAVGHDRRGNPLYCRTEKGELIETEEMQSVFTMAPEGHTVVETASRKHPLRHDELPSVAASFKEWVSQPDRMRWLNG